MKRLSADRPLAARGLRGAAPLARRSTSGSSAHIGIALGRLDDQPSLVRRMADRHAARRQRRDERQAQALGDLRGREPERRVVLVHDKPDRLGVHPGLAQPVEQFNRRHDRGHPLIAHEPGLVGDIGHLRDELAVREAAEVDDLVIEECAQPVHQPDARGIRYVAQVGEVRRQRGQRDAAGMTRERRIDEGAVEAAQIAHRLDEMNLAARVQEQRAVARGQPEIDERGLPPLARRTLLQQHRQVRGQRAHPHARARAEQDRDLAVPDRRLAEMVEQTARDAQRILPRRAEVDEVAHPGAQRGQRALRLRERTERDHGQARVGGAHRGGGDAGRRRAIGREVDEHQRRIEPRDALRERRRVERRRLHRARRDQCLREPAHVLVMRRGTHEIVGDGGFSQ
jgi:hypothetical protein